MEREVYAHIGNGGICFGVTNAEYGPKIEVIADLFGNKTNHIDIYVTKPVLEALANMFRIAAEKVEEGKEYVHAADLLRSDSEPMTYEGSTEWSNA